MRNLYNMPMFRDRLRNDLATQQLIERISLIGKGEAPDLADLEDDVVDEIVSENDDTSDESKENETPDDAIDSPENELIIEGNDTSDEGGESGITLVKCPPNVIDNSDMNS